MRAEVVGAILVPLLLGAVISCAPKRPANPLASDDPSVKIPAMKHAAAAHDRSAIPQLITDLDNDDPAIRMYAIEALRHLTGQDMGYRYYDDEAARAPAVQRWKQWPKARAATTKAGDKLG